MNGDELLPRVSDYLERAASDFPSRKALICGGRELNYRQYNHRVGELARSFSAAGLEPGRRVALLMNNRVENPLTFLAAERLGATSVLVNNRLQPDEIGYVLDDSRPTMMVVGEEFVSGEAGSALRDMLGSRFEKGSVLVAGEPPPESSFRSFGEIDNDEFRSGVYLPEGAPGPETPVAVIYTSGTTGRPKGAVLNERNIVFNLTSWRSRLPEGREEAVVGVFFPLFHSAGMIGGICGSIVNGFTVVLQDFDIEGSLRAIDEHGVNIMGAVAAMAALQLSHPSFDQYDYSSLEYLFMGAGPCPAEILEEVNRRMDADVIIGYGLTEGTMGNLITTLEEDTREHKLHTIGVPLPGVEVRLVDERRRDVPDGTVGEIAVKGPTVFAGYLDDPAATAEVVDEEGWLYTGDLALRDEDGYYRIAGRASEMYIRGGENVYPAEVEEALKEHPEVLLAAVLGIPDDVMGEVGRAYVLKVPGSGLSEEDVKRHCSKRLADYKVPAEVVFRDSVPLTPVGKILKKELAEEIREEFGL